MMTLLLWIERKAEAEMIGGLETRRGSCLLWNIYLSSTKNGGAKWIADFTNIALGATEP